MPLKRYFFIELKAREFNYLDAGQRSFYITPVDQQLREFGDNPTIKEVEDKLEIQTAMQEIKSKEVIRKTIKKRS